MESMKLKDKNEYRSVDVDALFTASCVIAILVILVFTEERGKCSQPFVFWFAMKSFSLTLRLALKAGFPSYSQQVWFRFSIALIKFFSICWIVYGLVMLILETKCTTKDNFYLGLLGFMVIFSLGMIVFFVLFIIAYISLNKKANEEDNENSNLQERLYIK